MAGLVPRLSGWDLVDKVHGVDSTRVRTLATFIGHESGANTVRHQNSVFHDLQKRIPWAEFDRLVEAHGADARVRRLSTKSQLMALLYAQLSGASSLREIEAGLASHAGRLYHLGATPVRRSTLADANALRPAAVFVDLFARLASHAHRGLRRALAETTYLIDSTGVRLSGLAAEWARFSAKACGAKVHVIYDADADQPTYAAVTAAKVNDVTVAQTMPIEPGATYVFDLGYYDYRWWAALDAAGCRIVTVSRQIHRSLASRNCRSPKAAPFSPTASALSRTSGRQSKEPVRRPGPRGPRPHRDGQGAAHPVERPRRQRARDR
jgi:hypothetical protein